MTKIKNSEKRILKYLSLVDTSLKYLSMICIKLNIDHSYAVIVLNGMVNKGWLNKTRHSRKMYYETTEYAPTVEATNDDR